MYIYLDRERFKGFTGGLVHQILNRRERQDKLWPYGVDNGEEKLTRRESYLLWHLVRQKRNCRVSNSRYQGDDQVVEVGLVWLSQ